MDPRESFLDEDEEDPVPADVRFANCFAFCSFFLFRRYCANVAMVELTFGSSDPEMGRLPLLVPVVLL